jgi:hypothetical protein
VQFELIAFDRKPKITFELAPLMRSLVQALLEESIGAPPASLAR